VAELVGGQITRQVEPMNAIAIIGPSLNPIGRVV
jgi:hypothetical protein